MKETYHPEQEPERQERNVPGDAEYTMFDGNSVDVNRLIHLTEKHPVEKVSLSDYAEKLDVDCWGDSNNEKVTPRTIINIIKELGAEEAFKAYPQYSTHIQKIVMADYSFPLHVYKGKIRNGAHRLAKIVLFNELGKINQDFILIKNLDNIPKETLTDINLLKSQYDNYGTDWT